MPWLRLTPLPLLEALSTAARVVEAPAGTAVVRQGDVGDRFFVVAEGELEVTRHDRSIRRLHRGDAFGEIALLRDVLRTATVRARTDVRLVALARNDFLALVGGDAASRRAADRVAQRYLDDDDAPTSRA